MKTKLGPVSLWAGCFVLPVNDGFDIVDRKSGRWAHFKNRRSARWSASVWTRLDSEFSASKPLGPRKMNEMDKEAQISAKKA